LDLNQLLLNITSKLHPNFFLSTHVSAFVLFPCIIFTLTVNMQKKSIGNEMQSKFETNQKFIELIIYSKKNKKQKLIHCS